MNISKGASAVLLAMCAGAASATGATPAAAAEGDLPSSVVADSKTVIKALPPQVRTVPGQIRDTVSPPQQPVNLPPLGGKAGDQQLDFGPFGILSANRTKPGEMARNAVAGALNKVAAVTESE
ncbi:hypothetical protein OG607_31915 [Streptomyces sp. NBC_01537]|uniref:hypothetical protein n=1 Tax=Streptomyces sp. NBC_01537 TaxID=2903896 RepID=UPI00386A5227